MTFAPGCRNSGCTHVHDLGGTRVSAGIAARQFVGTEVNSLVEEPHDIEYVGFNRQTWENSFAWTAISKRKFELVGSLNEVDFPNGYIDLDHSMRCRKAGLVNI